VRVRATLSTAAPSSRRVAIPKSRSYTWPDVSTRTFKSFKRGAPRNSRARARPHRRLAERAQRAGATAASREPLSHSSSTRHSRVETRLIREPVVHREISIVTRAAKSLSPAAETFAGCARHHARESLASERSSSRSR
jgi:hypothetical protein